MKFQFTLDEADSVDHHLFTASKSERIIKKRNRGRYSVPVIYVLLGVLLYNTGGTEAAVFMGVVAVLWFFIYPAWEKRRYKKHYEEAVKENLGSVAGTSVEVEVGEDYIIAKDFTGESKILTSTLVEINELPRVFLLKLTAGQNLVLPKTRITNMDDGVVMLRSLAQRLNIPYNDETGWEWK